MERAFRQIPIGMLLKRREVLVAVRTGKFSAVITENGEVHAFMVSLDEMDEVLAHEDNRSLQPQAIAQRELTTDPWNVFDLLKRAQVIKITFHGRPRFALISPKLQNYLTLPVIGEKEAI